MSQCNRSDALNGLYRRTNVVSRADILQLVQMVFTVMTATMHDDPANKMFFEYNVSGRVQVSHRL